MQPSTAHRALESSPRSGKNFNLFLSDLKSEPEDDAAASQLLQCRSLAIQDMQDSHRSMDALLKSTKPAGMEIPGTTAIGQLIPRRVESEENEEPETDPSKLIDESLPPVNKQERQMKLAEITPQQIVHEIRGIYSGVVIVESRCRAVYQSDIINKKLKPEQWQALYSLHHSLLLEHHDFFLATNHPYAAPVVRNLPEKYNMPSRMWKFGIHAFLEFMRKHQSETIDFMNAFLSIAYGMVTLLYETITPYRKVWAECLGDLSRYRMALEDTDWFAREVWMSSARTWYRTTLELVPNCGRLYHHLAILARPQPMTQLFYYYKSLCVEEPFAPTRESISMLIDPLIKNETKCHISVSQVDATFVTIHGLLFRSLTANRKDFDRQALLGQFENYKTEFFRYLREDITRHALKWLESGIYVSLSNISALLEFTNTGKTIIGAPDGDSVVFTSALDTFKQTLSSFVNGTSDPTCFSFLHCTFVFLHYLAENKLIPVVSEAIDWPVIARTLSAQIKAFPKALTTITQRFPHANDRSMTLPDDYALRGFPFAQGYFPERWFDNTMEESERLMERPSMKLIRCARILSLAYSFCRATGEGYMRYNEKTQVFDGSCLIGCYTQERQEKDEIDFVCNNK